MGTFTDIRDGEIYQTVNIGTQTWMAENFRGDFGTNYPPYNNSLNIPTLGRLYNLDSALSSAPSGWHLPTNDEMDVLINEVGGLSIAGKKLKDESWVVFPGTNDFGFTAKQTGYIDNYGSYSYETAVTQLWCNGDIVSSIYHKIYSLFDDRDSILPNYNKRQYGNSVRYIKDVYDPGNVAPTDITLSNNNINEHSSINTTVGSLTSTDADVGNTFTYTLVTGTGDTDNSSFNISGDLLRSSESFDYTTKSTYSIRIRTTDNQAGYFEKVFIINVVDVDSPPTNIILSNNILSNNTQLNSTIGTLSSVDVDPGDTFVYTLVSGTGDTDNSSFSISGDTLINNITFDYDIQSTYSIRVRSTDFYSEYFERQFQLNVSFPHGTSGKTIDYLTYLPQHLKDSEVYEFVKVFQDFSNGLYNTSLSAYPSYTAKYDDSNNISTGTKVVGISILEKIKKIAELRDPSMIDLDYVKYFASMFGYEINFSRQDIDTFLTGADIETSTSAAREFDINQHIRESLEVSPWFNKLKTSKTALQFILYSFGIVGYIKDVYTTDYKNEWIVFYNDVSQTLETFVTKECYPTPHFRLTVDLENTPTNWRNNITKIIDVVDTLKPIQTVFDGIEMFLLSHVTVYVHIASILKQTSVLNWNGNYAWLSCDPSFIGGEFSFIQHSDDYNVGVDSPGQFTSAAYTNAFRIGTTSTHIGVISNCIQCGGEDISPNLCVGYPS